MANLMPRVTAHHVTLAII